MSALLLFGGNQHRPVPIQSCSHSTVGWLQGAGESFCMGSQAVLQAAAVLAANTDCFIGHRYFEQTPWLAQRNAVQCYLENRMFDTELIKLERRSCTEY